MNNKERRRSLAVTILSLSLLTVMAGAAVAPALDVIRNHFSDANQMFVQMIISMPAIFIVITNMIFSRLCRVFRAKELVLAGLLLYVMGGCAAGLIDNIFVVLIFRALVGVGVGIIMPMSTGLISFYYTRDKQDRLMGYSSAMNQMGGVVATLISGLLATISWRASFLVYLMGVISFVLCFKFMPNEKIGSRDGGKEKGVFKKNYMFVIAAFLSMFIFFVYPSVFAIETAKEGIIPQNFITIIMAGMDLVAFAGGLSFVHIKKHMGKPTRFVAPILFFIGYVVLLVIDGWMGAIVGSFFIGFANGLEIPFIISTASRQVGKAAATTVMPMISMALYLAQFLTPIILSSVSKAIAALAIEHMSYGVAIIAAALFIAYAVEFER
ncbi:MAG: MFS transporter [Clostridiales bacterium]|nr:MFS transporter [Clostridiales bacterium]